MTVATALTGRYERGIALLGDKKRALDELERALAADSQMPWLGRDAILDPLRSEPRSVALTKRLSLAK